jgi:hypothetical protein
VRDKLSHLNDVELHQFASQLDTLYPGGGATTLLVTVLVIVVLVLVILKLTDHKIIIK